VARVLLVGGGCRGRLLAERLLAEGHAVRISTRTEAGRGAIEACGAECWVGNPARLATLRGVLDGVAIACWMLARAEGSEEELLELHRERLEFFLTQLIDSTVRGFVFERAGPREDGGSTPAGVLAAGEETARRMTARNAIPLEILRADPLEAPAWLDGAGVAIGRLLEGR
jgi:uncharacterized protein YbjT (DUF2867 family)